MASISAAAATKSPTHRFGGWQSQKSQSFDGIGEDCLLPAVKKQKVTTIGPQVVAIDLEEDDSGPVSVKPVKIPADPIDKRKQLYEAKDRQLLRISGSKVAAVAGLNRFTDIGELFLEYLYQDLLDLYIHDVDVLGLELELISDDEHRSQLMAKSGKAKDLLQALRIAEEAQDVESIQTALVKVEDALKVVSRDEKLDAEELGQLRELLSKEVRCGFGSKHEDAGIRAYEARVNSRVYDEQLNLCLRLPKGGAAVALAQAFPAGCTLVPRGATAARDAAGTPAVDAKGQPVFSADFLNMVAAKIAALKDVGTESVAFPPTLTSAERKYVHRTAEDAGVCSHSVGEGTDRYLKLYREASAAAADRQDVSEAERKADAMTHFKLIGKIDGLVDITLPPANGAPSKVKTIVMEMKNRTNKIADPPPIYEAVQLCTYCRILGCNEGDLVQCLRGRSTMASTPTPMSVQRAGTSLHVVRFDFREGNMDRDGWDKQVLPNLYAFADAVYSVRQDDNMRYRLLVADASERQRLVEDLCPHLER